MRVAIVAESFLPNVNGVTNSVLRVLEHCKTNGHDALVIAPGARDITEEVGTYLGFRIVRVPTVEVPLINSLPIGVPMPLMRRVLKDYAPDVVHLASPFVLGAAGAFVAKSLGIPSVAIYQTDVAGFANNYHLKLLSDAAWKWTRKIHNSCDMTLAPSSATIADLDKHGVENLNHWGRGVDAVRFNPARRSQSLRQSWARKDQTIVGFVGRLAAEKDVQRLAVLAHRDDIQLVIVGDGPDRKELESILPTAVFTGALSEMELAEAYASLDIFVHTGQYETFCQAIQEALASGVPVIGPRAGGPIDLIDDQVNGILLDIDTFEADLSAAVDTIKATDNYATYRDAARPSVQSRTWDSLCDQLFDYYETVIGRAIPRRRGDMLRPSAMRAARQRGQQSNQQSPVSHHEARRSA